MKKKLLALGVIGVLLSGVSYAHWGNKSEGYRNYMKYGKQGYKRDDIRNLKKVYELNKESLKAKQRVEIEKLFIDFKYYNKNMFNKKNIVYYKNDNFDKSAFIKTKTADMTMYIKAKAELIEKVFKILNKEQREKFIEMLK